MASDIDDLGVRISSEDRDLIVEMLAARQKRVRSDKKAAATRYENLDLIEKKIDRALNALGANESLARED